MTIYFKQPLHRWLIRVSVAFQEVAGQGVAQVIVVDAENGMLEGGLDRRVPDGGAAGY